MGVAEFNAFVANDWQLALSDSYLGIAPTFGYPKSYLTNKNPGVVIEFDTKVPGFINNLFATDLECSPKVESGVLSYGLGKTGNHGSCNQAALTSLLDDAGGSAATSAPALSWIFNTYLGDAPTFEARIVYVQATRNADLLS